MAKARQNGTIERGTAGAGLARPLADHPPVLSALVRLLARQAARDALASPENKQETEHDDPED